MPLGMYYNNFLNFFSELINCSKKIEINEVREKGGIRPIVNMLNCSNENLQAHAAKALSILCSDGT